MTKMSDVQRETAVSRSGDGSASAANMPAPYYQDDFATIYHGDALDLIGAVTPPVVQVSKRPGSSQPRTGEPASHLGSTPGRFDLAFADPPYNYGVEYDGYGDDRDPADYLAWCGEWWRGLRSVSGAVIVTPGHGNLPLWLAIAKPHGIGCWYKPGGTGSSFLGWCEWEPWLYWGPRLGGGDVVKATLNPTFKSDAGHPCPKPVELLKGLILKTKAQSVIDPFMGSGTTLVAAKALGVRAVGIEQSERYCEVTAARLTQGVLDLGGVA